MVAQDCARAYRANFVLTASPGQLVLLLYDGALRAIGMAREAFNRPARDLQRYEVINRELRKARRILGELQVRLDFGASAEFASLMYSLYDYYNRRLLEANLRKDPAPVEEVEQLLGAVRNAWSEMLKREPARAEAALAR